MDSLAPNGGALPTVVVTDDGPIVGDAVEFIVGDDCAVTAVTTPDTSRNGRDAVQDVLDDLAAIAPSVAWHEQGADDPGARADLLAALLAGHGGES